MSARELNYRDNALDDYKEKRKKSRLQRFTMFYGETVQEVVNLSLYYDDNNDNNNAIEALPYGLKLYPGNKRLLLHRASHFSSDEEFDQAQNDLNNITPDDIKNAWEGDVVADTFKKMNQTEKGIPFYKKSISISTKEEYPFNRLYWLAYKNIMSNVRYCRRQPVPIYSLSGLLPGLCEWTDRSDPDHTG